MCTNVFKSVRRSKITQLNVHSQNNSPRQCTCNDKTARLLGASMDEVYTSGSHCAAHPASSSTRPRASRKTIQKLSERIGTMPYVSDGLQLRLLLLPEKQATIYRGAPTLHVCLLRPSWEELLLPMSPKQQYSRKLHPYSDGKIPHGLLSKIL